MTARDDELHPEFHRRTRHRGHCAIGAQARVQRVGRGLRRANEADEGKSKHDGGQGTAHAAASTLCCDLEPGAEDPGGVLSKMWIANGGDQRNQVSLRVTA
jgi:hypothetical protein